MIENNQQFLYYYIIVSSLFFWALIFVKKAGRYTGGAVVFLVLLLSFLYSIRTSDIGSDAANYVKLITDNNNVLTQSMSPFIIFIGKLVYYLGGNTILFFMIISSSMNFLILYAFYKINSQKYIIYMAIYSVSFLFINANINILRQGLSVAVSFLAMYFLAKGKTIQFILLILCASFIHISAITLLFLILMVNVRNKGHLVAFAVILSLMYLFHISGVDFLGYIKNLHWSLERVYWYLTWDSAQLFTFKHVYYLYAVLFVIYGILFNRLDIFMRRLYLIFLGLFVIMTLFRTDAFVVDRLMFYFIPLSVVLYVNIYYYVKVNNNSLYLFLYIFIPFVWIFKSAYQFNLWWILHIVRQGAGG